jgi:hypothetical protein
MQNWHEWQRPYIRPSHLAHGEGCGGGAVEPLVLELYHATMEKASLLPFMDRPLPTHFMTASVIPIAGIQLLKAANIMRSFHQPALRPDSEYQSR